MGTKFYGKVGFGIMTEVDQDIHRDVITERPYRGDIKRDDLYIDGKKDVNPDLKISQLISFVMDAFAVEHYFNIRYVLWQGVRWNVTNISREPPRLVLRLGDKYNGPKPAVVPDDEPSP